MEATPLRDSLFPNVPPYLRFLPPSQSYHPPIPEELSKVVWAAPNGISPIVEEGVKHAQLTLKQGQEARMDSQNVISIWETLPVTEKGKDEIKFSELKQEAKINQFPGLFVIGRKDRLWTSYEKMRNRYGRENFGFLPQTYIVPEHKEEVK